MDKKSIRKNILEARNNLDTHENKKMDNIIEKKFLNSKEYICAKNIFIYI